MDILFLMAGYLVAAIIGVVIPVTILIINTKEVLRK